jgi:GDPmannose 4,6-dehydratase
MRLLGKVSKIYNKKLKLKKNQIIIKVNERFFRPNDVNNLLGDSSKAKKILKWEPKNDINLLINEMVDYDLIKANNELLLKNNLSKIC